MHSIRVCAILSVLAATAGPVSAEEWHDTAARVESIEGSDLHRVVLTERSAQRAGIATGVVASQPITRTMTIEGLVMAAPYLELAALLPSGSLEASATLVKAAPYPELAALLQSGSLEASATLVKAAHALSVASAAVGPKASIRPVGIGKIADHAADLVAVVGTDVPNGPSSLIFMMSAKDHGLAAQQRVFVTISTTERARKTIPAGALFYDEHGKAWVFTNPEPLVFIRHLVEVEFVQAGQAVLKEGPPDGTVVVTTGAMLLFGAEIGLGH